MRYNESLTLFIIICLRTMTDTKQPGQPEPTPEHTTAGHRSRLIEKMREKGPNALSDQEILEALLFFNYRRQDVKPVVKSLFSHYPDLIAILNAPRHELCRIRQLGPAAVDLVQIVTSLHQRLDQQALRAGDILSNWEAVKSFCTRRLGHLKIEKFMVIYLDGQNRVIVDEIVSSGTVNKTAVFPRELVRQALTHQASAVILVHNHPNHTPRASQADIEMTKRLFDALKLVDVSLHDHLIVAGNKCVSFKTQGLL